MAELIVAFDLASGRDALALAGRLPGLQWAKLGSMLYAREGPSVVKEFRQRGIRIFLDLKWHDIPNIVAGAVSAARELGVSIATAHCLGGRAMLTAAGRAAGKELALVGVTVLTSHDAGELESILGRGVPDVGFEAERLARMALQAGLRGVVASGQELGLLREALGPEPWIIVPGIRAPGDPAGDQVRTIEPAEAVRRGATHLVVGRPITEARDPVAAYRRLVEALGGGY
ncbi:MAG TPA: orotidine-5'-phosphate decarboxylase [Gemmatimonadales bacterium]|jgi:orotidine-5'-phosphate decarboxylase|nr:orotidine-5'-phosphate decarboxylase [Gemmatimonadales bacterium]